MVYHEIQTTLKVLLTLNLKETLNWQTTTWQRIVLHENDFIQSPFFPLDWKIVSVSNSLENRICDQFSGFE